MRRAVILAAGNGDRFRTQSRDSKLLQPLLGRPILLRTLEAARDAGVQAATVVLGYQAERVRVLVERAVPSGLTVSFAFNPEWELENGVSALAARSIPRMTSEKNSPCTSGRTMPMVWLRRMLSDRAATFGT